MIHTDETKARLSSIRKGSANPFWGKHHTPENRAKLSSILRFNAKNRTYDISVVSVKVPQEPTVLSYIAAMVDGEGSIGFRKTKDWKGPYVAIYNTDQKLREWMEEQTGITPSYRDFRGREDGWQWSVQSAVNVYVVCKALLPWLIIKRDRAEGVIGFLEDKYGDRLREAMHG